MNCFQSRVRLPLFVAAIACVSSFPALAQDSAPWVATWGMAPSAQPVALSSPATFTLKDQTLRMIEHTSVAGNAARIHLSNRFGTGPLTISDVHIGLTANQTNSTNIAVGSDHMVTFGGATSVTIAAGQEVISDSIAMNVPVATDVSVSLYFPSSNSYTETTSQPFTEQQNWFATGDVSGSTVLTPVDANTQRYFLTEIDVQNTALTGTLVTFGASITEGYNSTQNANHRWPDFLAARLNAAGMGVGISNAGIAGNNLLIDASETWGQSGVHRFALDGLGKTDEKWVVISDDPINDLTNAPSTTSAALIAGLQQIIGQAHTAGVKVVCSTLTPFGNDTKWTTDLETKREAINTFVTGSSSGCDAIIDQATAVADPSNPQVIAPGFDSGDGLHPNDAGYQAIANSVNLNIFSTASAQATAESPATQGQLHESANGQR